MRRRSFILFFGLPLVALGIYTNRLDTPVGVSVGLVLGALALWFVNERLRSRSS
jgi:hypothetical protein